MQQVNQIERQDIKTMIDMLDGIYVYEADEENIYSVIKSAISMLEDLGNLVHKLEHNLDNPKKKSEYLEKFIMISTEAFANKISELQLENANLKQELKDINRALLLI